MLDQSLGLLIARWFSFSVSGGAEWVNPTRLITEGLQKAAAASAAQEAPAASAATFLFFLFVVTSAASQAAHGVLHLLDGSPASATQSVPNNGQAFGHTAYGVLHLIEGSAASAFLSLLGFPSLLFFPSLG